jgi:hypothetical protein
MGKKKGRERGNVRDVAHVVKFGNVRHDDGKVGEGNEVDEGVAVRRRNGISSRS